MSTVRDLMTTDPVLMETTATARQAAERMRDHDIGDVLVSDGPTLRGIVTDRDLTTRVLAHGINADDVTLGDVASTDLDVVAPGDDAGEVVERMRRDAIRRVPVVDEGVPVGILSLGDLAIEYDEDSVLAQVSAARPDNQG